MTTSRRPQVLRPGGATTSTERTADSGTRRADLHRLRACVDSPTLDALVALWDGVDTFDIAELFGSHAYRTACLVNGYGPTIAHLRRAGLPLAVSRLCTCACMTPP